MPKRKTKPAKRDRAEPKKTPLDPDKVLQANIANIVKKAESGRTLTAAEIKLLNQFKGPSTPRPPAPDPEWVSSDQKLSDIFGHHRASFPRWRRQFEDAPRPRPNGDHNVPAWRSWFEKHPEIRNESPVAEMADLQIELLRQKCRRIVFDNDLREGLYVHKEILADHLGKFAGETVAILRQKVENEFPAAAQGRTIPQIREKAKVLVDEVLARFRAHFETWTI